MPDNIQMPAAVLQGLKEAINRKILPRQASSAPWLDRAVAELSKVYPKDTIGLDVAENSWDHPTAGSTELGTTQIADDQIRTNPVLSIFPQGLTEQTLAHELQHVRQNRAGGREAAKYEGYLPYNARPSEKDAMKAGNAYNTLKGRTGDWEADLSQYAGIPRLNKSK